MRNNKFVGWLALPLFALAFSASAADATGRWKTIDDETGKVKSIVEISKAANGRLSGKVVEIVNSTLGPNPACDKCSGANKGKPIKGMTILWNLQGEGTNEWAGGIILDPAKGKTYKAKARLLAGGDRLDVSGCIGPFCRDQTWVRE